MDRIQDALGRLEGVKEAKVGKNKFFYDLKVIEKKPLLPSHIRALVKKLDDYGFAGFEVNGVAGTVEKSGDGLVFTARGSSQKYGLKASEELKKLVAAGKMGVTLSGKVQQADDKATPSIEVAEAKETSK